MSNLMYSSLLFLEMLLMNLELIALINYTKSKDIQQGEQKTYHIYFEAPAGRLQSPWLHERKQPLVVD